MKKKIISGVLMFVMLFSFVLVYLCDFIAHNSPSIISYAVLEKPESLSDESAALFVGFILNNGKLKKEEIESMDMYRILTGRYSGNDEREKILELSWIIRTSTMDKQKNAEKNKEFLMNELIEYFDSIKGSTLDEKIINDEKAKLMSKFTDNVCAGIDEYFLDSVSDSLNISGSLTDYVTTSEVYSAYNTYKSTASKIEQMYDAIISGTELYMNVIDSDRAGRYSYFNTYLSVRENYLSPEDVAFQILMDYNKLAAADNSLLSKTLDTFTWITKKDSFSNHFETIDAWAEYVYQLEQYAQTLPVVNDIVLSEEPIVKVKPITFTDGNITYAITDEVKKEIEVYGYNDDSVISITVPSKVNRTTSDNNSNDNTISEDDGTYKVVGIYEYAFYGSNIQSITLPGLKNKLCNRIMHQKMTILKLQSKRATLRSDSTQAVR